MAYEADSAVRLQCGLDRSQRASHIDFDEQIEVMTQQIRLAVELKRPVSVSLPSSHLILLAPVPSCKL